MQLYYTQNNKIPGINRSIHVKNRIKLNLGLLIYLFHEHLIELAVTIIQNVSLKRRSPIKMCNSYRITLTFICGITELRVYLNDY